MAFSSNICSIANIQASNMVIHYLCKECIVLSTCAVYLPASQGSKLVINTITTDAGGKHHATHQSSSRVAWI